MINYQKARLREELDTLLTSFTSIKETVKAEDKSLYKRWKAGGFAIDGNFLSMYPSVESVVDDLLDEEENNEDE